MGRGAAGQPFDWLPLPFDPAWIAIVLCGVPIVLEAVIGLVTAFDIKADVLVSLALIASVCIGEDFAAGEVAFIMQLGGLLEDLTVAKARAGSRSWSTSPPAPPGCSPRRGRRWSRPRRSRWATCSRCCPGRPSRWTGVITRPDLHQPGGDDRRVPAGGQGPGDRGSSGTVNQFGAFEMRATKVGRTAPSSG